RVEAEENLYFANVHLANEALEDHDLARTHLLLRTIDASPVPRSKRGWEWRYLSGRSGGDQSTILDSQQVPLCGIAASADGKWLASLNEDGQVKLWDFRTKKEITNWLAHVSSRTARPDLRQQSVLFSSSTNTLITSGPDMTVRLWDIPAGKMLSEVKVREPVSRLALSKDGQVLAGGSFDYPTR